MYCLKRNKTTKFEQNSTRFETVIRTDLLRVPARQGEGLRGPSNHLYPHKVPQFTPGHLHVLGPDLTPLKPNVGDGKPILQRNRHSSLKHLQWMESFVLKLTFLQTQSTDQQASFFIDSLQWVWSFCIQHNLYMYILVYQETLTLNGCSVHCSFIYIWRYNIFTTNASQHCKCLTYHIDTCS